MSTCALVLFINILYYQKTENFIELANLNKDILLYYYTRINKEISDIVRLVPLTKYHDA